MSTMLLAKAAAGYGAFHFLIDRNIHLTHDIKRMYSMRRYITLLKNMPEAYTVTDSWYETVAKFGDKECLVCNDTVWSFQDVEKQSNQVAHWVAAQGWNKKTLALMMENRAEYFIVWLGCAKAGCTTALLNTNIRGRALRHSAHAADSVAMLCSSEMLPAVSEVDNLDMPIYVLFPDSPASRGTPVDLTTQPTTRVPNTLREGVTKNDAMVFIYTSGTTGLPKACIIPHVKFISVRAFYDLYSLRPDDRMYTVLPLYHTAGGMIGLGQMFMGVTSVLRKKFSAREWWRDCIHYKCTVAQYIGELCRYLLNTPPSGLDRAHKIRIMIGNGLRPEIWNQFQDRFGIPEIGEFYGATEANVALFNHCATPSARGAIGREGWLGNKFSGATIVEFDVENEIPKRDPQGFCKLAKTGEVGELIAPIDERRQFQGYTDEQATQKKILRDVFKKGDMYFRSGDLLRRDSNGFYFFVDRIGDTFRWKGENVSTMEVSEALSVFPGVEEANVYGVTVPENDGRACMAALTVASPESIDKVQLAKHVVKELPAYARPLFVRLVPSGGMDITGTFKHKKGSFVKDGYDLNQISDQIWWWDTEKKQYNPFTSDDLQLVLGGRAKL